VLAGRAMEVFLVTWKDSENCGEGKRKDLTLAHAFALIEEACLYQK
jgi:hypothetical protein